jgi:hypothetical protein
MCNKKKKAQGALEYLLLIGGAVLIAVIVIALLVGMGGQSRDTAQNQATQAQQALEQPQAASIVSLTPVNCNSTLDDANLTVGWQALGEGGTHKFKLYDHSGDLLVFDNKQDEIKLTNTNQLVRITMTGNCEDTYWGEIETEKNGQFVNSTRMSVNFTEN